MLHTVGRRLWRYTIQIDLSRIQVDLAVAHAGLNNLRPEMMIGWKIDDLDLDLGFLLDTTGEPA